MSRALLLALALGLLPGLALAQGTGGRGGDASGPGWAAPGWGPGIDAARVAGRLQEIGVYCGWLGRGYEVDCLADQYAQMRAWLPNARAYDPLRQALWRAERRLKAVVEQHRDTRVQPVRPSARGNPTGLRASRAIARSLPSAAAPARQVLEETETILLRSADGSQERRAAFQRVATALGTNKRILRS